MRQQKKLTQVYPPPPHLLGLWYRLVGSLKYYPSLEWSQAQGLALIEGLAL
jgi:hypothetical protein